MEEYTYEELNGKYSDLNNLLNKDNYYLTSPLFRIKNCSFPFICKRRYVVDEKDFLSYSDINDIMINIYKNMK